MTLSSKIGMDIQHKWTAFSKKILKAIAWSKCKNTIHKEF